MNNISQFIDKRNSELWNSLNSKFNIRIQQSENREYSCFTKNNDAIIFVDENNICKDSFTHELLHIHLKDKEFFLGSSLKLTIAQSRIDRKSTRLNSSHVRISYAVFCLKKKKRHK